MLGNCRFYLPCQLIRSVARENGQKRDVDINFMITVIQVAPLFAPSK